MAEEVEIPEVLYAHELARDGSERKIRMMLFADGVVVSCAVDTTGSEPECCYASSPGQKEAYFAFQALLADKGYRVRPVEVENNETEEARLKALEKGIVV